VCSNNYSFSGFDGGGDDILPVWHDALQSGLQGEGGEEEERVRRGKEERGR
jgi:hypothetical protein